CGGDHRPPLFGAAKQSMPNEQVLEVLLADQRLDAFVKWPTDMTALHWVAYGGHPSHVTPLLRKGLDPNEQAARGKTPLHLAVIMNNTGAIKMLLCDKRIDPNVRDTESVTPLHQCVRLKRGGELLNLLLAHDRIQPNVRTEDDMTPFMDAIWIGNQTAILALFDCKNFNMADSLPENPRELYDSVHRGRFAKPDQLITVPDASWTPMMYAAARGEVDVLRVLYDSGRVPIHAKDRLGRTAMDIAAAKGIPMQYHSS
ncbi:ankyrin repeat domain-containing protein, partial [Candidatus Bathyarchaeota archaeon]|nr:ankyrin repeat domain-containing protein [Candidatus Bathyarchaeota archaeon]